MKLEYEKEDDVAYIYLEYPIESGAVKKTIALNDEIILDFDENEKLLGVEILNASKHLKKQILTTTA